MAGQGRVISAKATVWATLALLIFLQRGELVESRELIVGGESGWTYKISDWPTNKLFRDGDTLVFNYLEGKHNVVKVNEHGYLTCTVPNDSIIYTSGHDRIEINYGANYFISSFPRHCFLGMNIKVDVKIRL